MTCHALERMFNDLSVNKLFVNDDMCANYVKLKNIDLSILFKNVKIVINMTMFQ